MRMIKNIFIHGHVSLGFGAGLKLPLEVLQGFSWKYLIESLRREMDDFFLVFSSLGPAPTQIRWKERI